MDLPFSEHSLAYSGLPLPTSFMHGHLSSLLDSQASLEGLIGQPQGLLQHRFPAASRLAHSKCFRCGVRGRRRGGMAAALTLLTEISISVMGVGTCGRRRAKGGGLGPDLPWVPASASSSPLPPSLGQCPPWQLRPDSFPRRRVIRKVPSPWLASKEEAWRKAQSSCPLPQPCSLARRQRPHITCPVSGAQQSPRWCPAWLYRGAHRSP